MVADFETDYIAYISSIISPESKIFLLINSRGQVKPCPSPDIEFCRLRKLHVWTWYSNPHIA